MRRGELGAYTAAIAACLLGWAGLLAVLAGPTVEGDLAPVHVDQRVEGVARDDGRLCWTWARVKRRDLATDDLDVFLYVGADRVVVAPFSAADGRPWSRANAAPLGRVAKRFCVAVPPGTPEGAALRLEQTLWYRGLLGLWRVPLRVPDVVHPPAPAGDGP